VAEASVVVRVDASQAVKPLNDVSKAATTGKQKLDNLGKSAGGAQTKLASLKGAASQLGTVLRGVAGIAILSFFKSAAGAASDFEAETLLLERGLKNVGAGAGELDKLQQSADRLGKQTLFNEDEFRQGFGLLTSFGNIGVSTYDSVAMAAANVAQVSGTDVSSAFMQLAKALNDPITNLSALSRSGIQFTEEQKATIKSLVETGQAAKAQSMILKELEKQYGGTAVAAAGGAAGVRDTFGEAMYDLQKAVGGVVNTALPPLLNALTTLINAFTSLPAPVQTFIVGLTGLVAAVAVLAPVIGGLVTTFKLFAGLKIGATIAGWLPAVVQLGASLGGLAKILIGVFSGPVGWVALAVAAGVAIYNFRDQIGQAFNAIGGLIKKAANLYKTVWIDPVISLGKKVFDTLKGIFDKVFDVLSEPFQKAWDFVSNNFLNPIGDAVTQTIQNIQSGWARLGEILSAPFKAAASVIRSVLNNIIGGVENVINGMVNAINRLVSGANRISSAVGGPQIPTIPNVSFGRFADGGVVDGPTLGLIGEGGEREYVVPESKAAGFASNYLQGQRGASAIPGFAEGGVAGPINIHTGPVMQQDGRNYVTVEQFTQGMLDLRDYVAGSRSYGARRYGGIS
jgi:hypothetical protein